MNKEDSMSPTRLLILLTTTMVLTYPGPGLATESPASDSVLVGASSPEIGDCSLLDDLVEKEACYAAVSPVAIEECESLRPLRCAPYRDMHFATAELDQLVEQLASASRSTYREYSTADPAYVDDLVTAINQAHRAWREWRDADCALSPYLDGMARTEAADLIESCRYEQTRQRIQALRSDIDALEGSDG